MKELLQQQRQESSNVLNTTPSRQAPPPPLPYPGYHQPSPNLANLPYPNQNPYNMPMPPSYR